jgi:hypothetical protein
MLPSRSIDYDEAIPDGFYEAFGDFPELVEPGELPTLAALKHAQIIEGDLREVMGGQLGAVRGWRGDRQGR